MVHRNARRLLLSLGVVFDAYCLHRARVVLVEAGLVEAGLVETGRLGVELDTVLLHSVEAAPCGSSTLGRIFDAQSLFDDDKDSPGKRG